MKKKSRGGQKADLVLGGGGNIHFIPIIQKKGDKKVSCGKFFFRVELYSGKVRDIKKITFALTLI